MYIFTHRTEEEIKYVQTAHIRMHACAYKHIYSMLAYQEYILVHITFVDGVLTSVSEQWF